MLHLAKRPRSRDMISSELFEFVVPLSERAQGKPGADCARSLEGNKKQAHQLVTTSSASHTGFPRAMVLRLTSCSPR